jgi:hypothetical protein
MHVRDKHLAQSGNGVTENVEGSYRILPGIEHEELPSGYHGRARGSACRIIAGAARSGDDHVYARIIQDCFMVTRDLLVDIAANDLFNGVVACADASNSNA